MPIQFTLDPKSSQRLAKLGFSPGNLSHQVVKFCDLCGGQIFRTIAHQDRYGFEGSYQMCTSCGLVFQNPHPTADAYREFYHKWYRPLLTAYKGYHENRDTIQDKQSAYAQQLLRFIKETGGVRSTVQAVDLGGSTGIIAQAIEKHLDGRCLVVDPSAEELEVASKAGLNTEIGLAETWDAGPRQFDLVLICRSIDHLLSISQVLRKVATILKPNGYFYVDYVDFESAARTTTDYRNFLKIDHVYYLSETTMRRYLKIHGFEILTSDFANYQPAFLCRYVGGSIEGKFSPDYAQWMGQTLRERLVARPPFYPEDFLTRLYRRARNLIKKG